MSDDEEKIEKISKVTSKGRAQPAIDFDQPPLDRVAPNKEKFDQALSIDGSLTTNKVEMGQGSLLDEVRALGREVSNAGHVDPIALAEQSKGVIAQIEEIKARLNDPSLEIKSDYKRILRNKLEHIDGNLKIALEKSGLEYLPPRLTEGQGSSPVERFLGLLTNGQEQLKTLGGELAAYGDTATHISPANLLLVQIKVNYIQQELEFFTSLLNKALESTKTIMNVQV